MKCSLPGVTFAILSVVFTIVADRAGAQYLDSLGGRWNNPSSAMLGTMSFNRMLLDAARRGNPPDGTAAPSRAAKPPGKTRTTFRPVAGRLMARELADTMATDETMRQGLARLFDVYLRQFDESARSDGDEANDVSRAAAFFLMANCAVISGREPTDEQANGAHAKFRAGLAANADFARMKDRDRQRLHETLVILGSLPVTGLAEARQRNDNVRERQFREFARQNVQALLGVPADKVRLTPTGFTIDQ